jgi:ribulose 1,5-bisphosphate synthetase/thiazole synthase
VFWALSKLTPIKLGGNSQQKKHRRTIENYDIITIGSGHNALVAAALLASTGQRVLMLE